MLIADYVFISRNTNRSKSYASTSGWGGLIEGRKTHASEGFDDVTNRIGGGRQATWEDGTGRLEAFPCPTSKCEILLLLTVFNSF